MGPHVPWTSGVISEIDPTEEDPKQARMRATAGSMAHTSPGSLALPFVFATAQCCAGV